MKNDFFGFCIPLAKYIYILPDITPQDHTKPLLHKIFAVIIYVLALFCYFSEVVKLYQIVTGEYFVYDELIRNYTVSYFHFTSLIKAVNIKGAISARTFKTIIGFEDNIYNGEDEDIRKVYKASVTPIQRVRKYYMAGMVMVVICYACAPAFRDPIEIQRENETIRIRQLPISAWSPVEEYFWLDFVWKSLVGAYLAYFFVTTDLILYSFIAFGACQVRILQHYIHNFNRYCEDIMHTEGVSKNESARLLQKQLIAMHQDVISYVNMINGSIKQLMMLEFIPGSVQLAGMLYQLMTNLNAIQCIFLGQFISCLIARIFIYTNSANDLSQLSQQLAADWFEIDWIELPKDIKMNLNICILRCQKNLCIIVGDLNAIDMTTFLTILKGSYLFLFRF
ncbi:hypothetical protein YQE_01866, partial [Dendroctonus ponderosae]